LIYLCRILPVFFVQFAQKAITQLKNIVISSNIKFMWIAAFVYQHTLHNILLIDSVSIALWKMFQKLGVRRFLFVALTVQLSELVQPLSICAILLWFCENFTKIFVYFCIFCLIFLVNYVITQVFEAKNRNSLWCKEFWGFWWYFL
jgi:hypothetical protein